MTAISVSISMPDGHRVHPFYPDPKEIRIEDIAHALANTCRWGGRCDPWYSVAQHSLHVMQLVEPLYPELAIHALLHDAAESYLGDVPTPLKDRMCFRSFDDTFTFDEVEKRLLVAIYDAFSIPMFDERARAVVKLADAVALATEARDVMGGLRWEGMLQADANKIVPQGPEWAKRAFTNAFERLSGRLS